MLIQYKYYCSTICVVNITEYFKFEKCYKITKRCNVTLTREAKSPSQTPNETRWKSNDCKFSSIYAFAELFEPHAAILLLF